MSLSARFFGGASEQIDPDKFIGNPSGEAAVSRLDLWKLFRPCAHGSMSYSQERHSPSNHSISGLLAETSWPQAMTSFYSIGE
jgi:hypothetical protein